MTLRIIDHPIRAARPTLRTVGALKFSDPNANAAMAYRSQDGGGSPPQRHQRPPDFASQNPVLLALQSLLASPGERQMVSPLTTAAPPVTSVPASGGDGSRPKKRRVKRSHSPLLKPAMLPQQSLAPPQERQPISLPTIAAPVSSVPGSGGAASRSGKRRIKHLIHLRPPQPPLLSQQSLAPPEQCHPPNLFNEGLLLPVVRGHVDQFHADLHKNPPIHDEEIEHRITVLHKIVQDCKNRGENQELAEQQAGTQTKPWTCPQF